MPFYTAYISALDAFVADRGFCPKSFGSCCLEQREVDNFHAIHDRSLVDSRISLLIAIDPNLFYLPKETVSDQDLPPLTSSQQTSVDTVWRITQDALEDRPDSYVTVWSVLPSGLNMLHDPRRSETCAEFEKYKTSASASQLVTSVNMILEVAAIALHGFYLGVSEQNAVQILFHATAFIFNGIRCETLQNDDLIVPTSFYPFYIAKMRKHIQNLGESHTAIPAIPPAIVDEYLGNTLRVLSSYKSWGRLDHLVTNGVTTSKRNIKEDMFLPAKTSMILGYMLTHTTMTDAQRVRVQSIKNSADGNQVLSTNQNEQWSLVVGLGASSQLKFVYRQVTCGSLYHPYPDDPATGLSGCCADLCDQSSLLQTLTPPLSKSDCCLHCNEAQCDVEDNPSNPLSALEEVHLIPYYEGGSENVNL